MIESGRPSTTAASSPQTLKRHQKNRNHASGRRKTTIAELMNKNQLTMLSTKRIVTVAAKINSASVVSRLTQTLPSSFAKRAGSRSFTTKLPPQLMSELNEPMNAATSAATSKPMKPCGRLDALINSPHACAGSFNMVEPAGIAPRFFVRSAVQNSDIATIPKPINGSVRNDNARNELKSWPPTAWRSSRAAMNRCAVIPPPAVGDPAKNQPCTNNAINVSTSIEALGGVCTRPDGRIS